VSADKTFVGSVTGYYDNNSLVLTNSLTDAEAAGTETFYFIKHGVLKKVFIVAATFEPNDEWKEYYSKHRSNENCYHCHGKPNCIVTEITMNKKPIITVTEGKQKRELTQDESGELLNEVQKTSEELEILLNELK
jgi:hypothetical protein